MTTTMKHMQELTEIEDICRSRNVDWSTAIRIWEKIHNKKSSWVAGDRK